MMLRHIEFWALLGSWCVMVVLTAAWHQAVVVLDGTMTVCLDCLGEGLVELVLLVALCAALTVALAARFTS